MTNSPPETFAAFPSGPPEPCGDTHSFRLREDLTIEAQCQHLWCWASVAAYLIRLSDQQADQSTVASKVTFQDCSGPCGSPNLPSLCTQSKGLSTVFRRTGLPFEQQAVPSWETIARELTDGGPVPFRVFDGEAGHFGVISGWVECEDRLLVEVMDPAGGFVRFLPFSTLKSRYPGWGPACNAYRRTADAGTESDPKAVGARAYEASETRAPRGLVADFQVGPGWGEPPIGEWVRGKKPSRLCLPPAWKTLVRAHLAELFAFGAHAPLLLRHVQPADLRVFGPIFVEEVKLESPIYGLQVENNVGFLLRDQGVEGGRDIGYLELRVETATGQPSRLVFDSLSFAPGDGGDRFAAALRRALGALAIAGSGAIALLVRVPHLYEAALSALEPERDLFPPDDFVPTVPLGADFSFFLAEDLVMQTWGSYLERLSEIEGALRTNELAG
ncbi:MAG: hypothetical protein MI919_31715 [Holophagales bacterium]|nr:hypothetical protein [Holophagales bacterium]